MFTWSNIPFPPELSIVIHAVVLELLLCPLKHCVLLSSGVLFPSESRRPCGLSPGCPWPASRLPVDFPCCGSFAPRVTVLRLIGMGSDNDLFLQLKLR